MWTLDELVERVRLALAAEYPGAPNNRVRDLPDRRAIRWYTTIGLVDRPIGMRGRAALYGRRHLLQLVALKRRQAEGRTLAEIQVELAGAAADALAGVARVPTELLADAGPADGYDAGPVRGRFWAVPAAAAPATSAQATASAAAAPVGAPGVAALDLAGPARAEAGHAAGALAHPWSRPERAEAAAAPPADARPYDGTPAPPPPVGGVALGPGVILVVPGLPTTADRAEIAAAARPLMDLLADRGLLNTEDGSPS